MLFWTVLRNTGTLADVVAVSNNKMKREKDRKIGNRVDFQHVWEKI